MFKRFDLPAVAGVYKAGRLILGLAVIAGIGAAQAPVFTALYSFGGGSNGRNPEASLAAGPSGTLLGTTSYGGAFEYGTAFQLTPGAGGTWTQSVMYSFQGGDHDGANPSSGLTAGPKGVYFGTTAGGGANNGTVFQLTPAGGGAWTETVLYSFQGGNDGSGPDGGVIVDSSGNLYGVTSGGGSLGYGTIYELSPATGGGYTEQVIYTFQGNKDGATPQGSLTFGPPNDSLFGTTCCGTQGTVFRLSNSAGKWTKTILHSFTSYSQGAFPNGGLVYSNGVVYGTTSAGGPSGQGTVFSLTFPKKGKIWAYTAIHNFTGGNDGSEPYGSVALGANGVLYVTTFAGGTWESGVVAQFTPPTVSGGAWTETVLYNFTGGTDGSEPFAGVLDSGGTLYGTTNNGGASDNGTVYQLVP